MKNKPKIASIENVGSILGPFHSITEVIKRENAIMKIMVALSTSILFGANISMVVSIMFVPYG